jgi:hypothetical protein
MTEVEVTLLNVGGINNTPLEYYAGMNEEQSYVMDALLKAAIKKNVTGQQEGMGDFQKKLFDNWKELLATTNDNSRNFIKPTELGTKIYNKIKGLDDGITLDENHTLIKILDDDLVVMPDITTRFRSSILGLSIFDKEKISLIMNRITDGTHDIRQIVEDYYDKYVLDSNQFSNKVSERHWKEEAIIDKTDNLKKVYYRLGVLFDIYAHIATLYDGYNALEHKQKELFKRFKDSYEAISTKLMADKKTALEQFLSRQGENKVVLLNECVSGTPEVDPHSYTKEKQDLVEGANGKKYSAICCLGKDIAFDSTDTDKAPEILKIINEIGGIFAEGAVAKVTVGGKAVYFVVIHCSSWTKDEETTGLERANSIKKLLDDLKGSEDLKNDKIIIGIDTNTGHIQNLGNATNAPDSSGDPATNDTQQNWRIIAPEVVNENDEVKDGVSSNEYFTVNQTRSFFQSQIGKAGVIDKKTKDLIIGLNIDEFKDMQILEYGEVGWTERKQDSKAPNDKNPFDHYAVRVKIRVGEAPAAVEPVASAAAEPVAPPPAKQSTEPKLASEIAQSGGDLTFSKLGNDYDNLWVNTSITSNGSCFFDSLTLAYNLGLNGASKTTVSSMREFIADNYGKEVYDGIQSSASAEEHLTDFANTANFDEFKTKLKTSNDFWAEDSTIGLAQNLYNIKVYLVDSSGAVKCGPSTNEHKPYVCRVCGIKQNEHLKIMMNTYSPQDEQSLRDKIKDSFHKHIFQKNKNDGDSGNLQTLTDEETTKINIDVDDTDLSELINLYKDKIVHSGNDTLNLESLFVQDTSGDSSSAITLDNFVLMKYNGSHYQLIHQSESVPTSTPYGKVIFTTANEIPSTLKEKISHACTDTVSKEKFGFTS